MISDGQELLNSVQSGSYELVKFFVEKGADIYEKTKADENCLHIAALNGHLNLCQTLIDDHGFDIKILLIITDGQHFLILFKVEVMS